MASSPICTIDETGIHRPDLDYVRGWVEARYREIYGQDIYLGNDCQDGQLMALLSLAFHDMNAAMVAVFNAYSPAGAQGTGLSNVVQINGIVRAQPSRSTVDLRIVGQAGVLISQGQVGDADSNRWTLPETVRIPNSGEITVTATAVEDGAISAPPGTVTQIITRTPGWQEVTNLTAAAPGLPVEQDPALRQRQKLSTLIPARPLLDAARGVVAAIPGVSRLRVYENDQDRTDDDRLPGHSVAFVVEGGDAFAVAATIYSRKGAAGTYGSTQVEVGDAMGVPRLISFSRPRSVPISYLIRLRALRGFDLNVETAIQTAVAQWTVSLGIGGDIARALLRTRAFRPALLPEDDPQRSTFEIVEVLVSRDGDRPAAVDIPFAFDEAPVCGVEDVGVEVLP